MAGFLEFPRNESAFTVKCHGPNLRAQNADTGDEVMAV